MRQPQAGQEGKWREMQPLPGSPRLQAREPRIITRFAGFGEARFASPVSGGEKGRFPVGKTAFCLNAMGRWHIA